MREYHIRSFTGLDYKTNEVDQDRGTLRTATGVMIVPNKAISFGPSWKTSYPFSDYDFVADATYFYEQAGCSREKVHFATLTNSAGIYLIALYLATSATRVRCFGLWHVQPSANPNFNITSSGTLTFIPGVGAEKTPQPWFGSWIGDLLFLGNGVDTNLVWKNGALYELGPTLRPNDPDDPNQESFPPCTAFIRAKDGVIYGAGNRVNNSARVWASEKPSATFPVISGIKSAEWSFTDIASPPSSTITALSFGGGGVVAHFGSSGCVIVDAYSGQASSAGWNGAQRPAASSSGAPNQNCVRDTKQRPIYLGADGEVYGPITASEGYDSERDRRGQVYTDRAAGVWNREILNPYLLDAPAINQASISTIYDERAARLWIFATSTYVYDQTSSTITGPFIYPRFDVVTSARGTPSCIAVGLTQSGQFVWSDLGAVGTRETILPAYSTGDALVAPYVPSSTPIQPGPSKSVAIVSADGQKFMQRYLFGTAQTQRVMTSPWDSVFYSDTFPTSGASFFDGGVFSVIQLNTEDMGLPSMVKEFANVRIYWQRNSVAYVGVFAEGDGLRVGKWRGTRYPRTEQLCRLGISARNIKIRIIAITWPGQPALLEGLSIDWLPGGSL